MDHLADAPIANILILAGVIFLAVGLFGRIGGFIGSIFGNIEAGKSSRVLAGTLGGLLILGGGWMHQQGDKAAASHPPSATPVATPAAVVPSPSNASVAPVATPAATTPTSPASGTTPVPAKSKATQPTMAAKRENLPLARAEPAHLAPARPSFDERIVGTWTNVIPPQEDGSTRIQIVRAESGLDVEMWRKCSSGECEMGVHHLAVSANTSSFDFVYNNRRLVGSMNVYAPNILLLSVDIYEPGTSHHWHHNRVFSNSNLPGQIQVAFSKYLDSPGQKAFAMTPSGRCAWHLKSNTAEEAAQTALQNCQNHGWRDCRIILVGDEGPQQ